MVICFMALPLLAQAATYYVCGNVSSCNSNGASGWSGTPSDSNAGTSKGAPLLTIRGGLGKMSGGDTLTIGNGTYQGASNVINGGDQQGYSFSGIKGSSSAYTVISAENDWGVTIDGQGTATTAFISGWQYGVIRGIIFANSDYGALRMDGADHVKIIRCGGRDSTGQQMVFTGGTTNSLMEQCVAWGAGSYFFSDNNYWGANNNNIFRANVSRRDFYNSVGDSNHYASFNTYFGATTAVYFQNSISVDGTTSGNAGVDTNWYTDASLYTANGGNGVTVNGFLAINDCGQSAQLESGTTASITNAAFYQVPDALGFSTGIYSYASNPYSNIIVHGAMNDASNGGGYALASTGGSATVTNSIIYGDGYGLSSVGGTLTSNYNDVEGNTTNYLSVSAGANDKSYAPTSNGLLYPVRIESGANLATAGSGGGQIGPTILYYIGRGASGSAACGGPVNNSLSCTTYTDTGWNEVQDGQSGRALAPLWPFPNEATIKSMMSLYSNHGVSGARGFCTGTSKDGSAQTLTKYIWEYLGNQIPSTVYTSQNTNQTLAAPTGFHIVQ
jgi:hypothetical protein